MVNNPPGYFLASGRTGVVIPYGNEEMVRAAAQEYRAKYLILEVANSGHLDVLYVQPADQAGFHYLTTIGTAHLYEFTD